MIGTKKLLNLANQMPNLESVVHISTGYVMSHQPHLEEKIYKNPKMTPDDLIQIASLRPDLIDEQKIIQPFYGSYFMTKCMTEQMISEEYAHLPIAILRPTIVTASSKYPSPGFIDNANVHTGSIILTAKGLLRGWHFTKESNFEMLPVDLATNAAIVAAWYTASQKSVKEDIKIYNLFNPKVLDYSDFGQGIDENIAKFPIETMVWKPSKYLSKFKVSDQLYQSLSPIIGKIGDKLSGTKTLSKALKKATDYAKAMEPWRYGKIHGYTNNAELLRQKLLTTDKESVEKFDFDRESMDWKKYAEDYYHGVRSHLLNEKSDRDFTEARNRLKKLQVIHYGTQTSFLLLLLLLAKNII